MKRKPASKKVARRRNPKEPGAEAIKAAANFYKTVNWGIPPKEMLSLKHRPILAGEVFAAIGELTAVEYVSKKSGKLEAYRHTFKRGRRPQLVTSQDGKQLYIAGGSYLTNERGIVG